MEFKPASPKLSRQRTCAGPQGCTPEGAAPTTCGQLAREAGGTSGLDSSAWGGALRRRGFRLPPPLLPGETAAGRRKEPAPRLGAERWWPWRSRSPGLGAGPCVRRCHPPPSSPRCSRCWCPGPACSCCSRPWRPRASRCGPRPCATGKVSRGGAGPRGPALFPPPRQAIPASEPQAAPPATPSAPSFSPPGGPVPYPASLSL